MTAAVFTVPEAAEYMKISVRTLYRLTAQRGAGALTVVAVSPGRRVLRKVDIDRYLARRAA